jgi:MarR family transcriptional regulator, temperature-dependent positive regulator of motility
LENQNIADVRSALEAALVSFASIEEKVATALAELRDTEIRLRRARAQHFPTGYFSDVAWDVLLELDRAERLGQTFAITDIGVDAEIPLTTILRYLSKLEKDGFILRCQDVADRRRSVISLTDSGRAALHSVFQAVIRTSTEKPISAPPELRIAS